MGFNDTTIVHIDVGNFARIRPNRRIGRLYEEAKCRTLSIDAIDLKTREFGLLLKVYTITHINSAVHKITQLSRYCGTSQSK